MPGMLVLRPSMASAVPELTLLARDQAFEALYRRYVKDVYRYALALLRNPADAEDVTQTTFMNAYRAYRRGDEILKPHNWLIKIAHNVARTRYARASRRVKEVPLEDHVDQLAVPEEERPNVEGVLRALGRLPFNQRAALVMRELEGRPYAEIAETLDVSVSAVETLIFRARKALRMRASSLRVLTAVPLPGSLSQLFGGGAAVGGGGAIVGTGFLAKAAIALMAGAFATGIGGDRTGPAKAAQAGPSASASDSTAGTGLKAGKPDAADRSRGRATAAPGARNDSPNTTRGPGTADELQTVSTHSPATQSGTQVPGSSAATALPPSTSVQQAVTEVVAQIADAAKAVPVQVPAVPALPAIPALPALPAIPALPPVPVEPPPLPPVPKLP
jgi:RNA polymerase sigma factor (sigma-70 family)